MFKQYTKSEDGNFSIIAAAGFGLLALGVAISVEISRAHSLDNSLQDSLDIATLYAAQAIKDGDFDDDDNDNINEDNPKQDSIFHFRENFNSIHSANVTSIDFELDDGKMIGTASAEMSLTFAGLLNRDKLTVNARSVVNLSSGGSSPCIMALNPDRQPGILLNGGANVVAPDCEMHVYSTQNPAFTLNGGTVLDVKKVCVEGNIVRNNSGFPSIANLERNCEAAPDPYAGVLPQPDTSGCDYSSRVYNDFNLVLRPGIYCGTHNIKSEQVEFEPGLYILKEGGWVIDGGNWEGEGVTFYYADRADIQFNSAVAAELSAPTSGPYKDVFMYEAPNIPYTANQWVLNDTRGFDFEGIIYLPSRQVVFNSNANLRSLRMDIVAGSVIFNNASIELEPINGTGGAQSGQVYLSE